MGERGGFFFKDASHTSMKVHREGDGEIGGFFFKDVSHTSMKVHREMERERDFIFEDVICFYSNM